MLSDCSLSVCPVLSVKWVYCGQTVGWIKMKLGMHIVLGGDPAPSREGHNPKFSAHICCGQITKWIKMPVGRKVDLGRPSDIVLDGDPALPPKKRAEPPPLFAPCLLWPNGWMDQDATWYGGRPWPMPHCVGWGPSSPSSKRGHSPQFSAHLYCGQTALWLKMPLDTKVGLGPCHIVLDGDPARPHERGTAAPAYFRLMSIVATVAHLRYC